MEKSKRITVEIDNQLKEANLVISAALASDENRLVIVKQLQGKPYQFFTGESAEEVTAEDLVEHLNDMYAEILGVDQIEDLSTLAAELEDKLIDQAYTGFIEVIKLFREEAHALGEKLRLRPRGLIKFQTINKLVLNLEAALRANGYSPNELNLSGFKIVTYKPQTKKVGKNEVVVPFAMHKEKAEQFAVSEEKAAEEVTVLKINEEMAARVQKLQATEEDLRAFTAEEAKAYNDRLAFDRIMKLEATDEDLDFLFNFDRSSYRAYFKRIAVKAIDAPGDHPKPDEEIVTLLGSSSHPNDIQVGEDKIPLGDIIDAAYTASKLSIEEWNALTDTARDQRITDYITLIELTGGMDAPDPDKAKLDQIVIEIQTLEDLPDLDKAQKKTLANLKGQRTRLNKKLSPA